MDVRGGERTRVIRKDGSVSLYEAHPTIGESSLEAYRGAQAWVATDRADEVDP